MLRDDDRSDLERWEYEVGKCGEWIVYDENRGKFVLADDGGAMSLRIDGFCEGGIVEDRVDWIQTALEWTAARLSQTSTKQIIEHLDRGIVEDRDLHFSGIRKLKEGHATSRDRRTEKKAAILERERPHAAAKEQVHALLRKAVDTLDAAVSPRARELIAGQIETALHWLDGAPLPAK